MEKCPKCRKYVARLTRDHIIPQAFKKVTSLVGLKFDFDAENNIQMICAKCNVRKGHRLDMRALPILKEVESTAKRLNIVLPKNLLIGFKVTYELKQIYKTK